MHLTVMAKIVNGASQLRNIQAAYPHHVRSCIVCNDLLMNTKLLVAIDLYENMANNDHDVSRLDDASGSNEPRPYSLQQAC